MKAKKLRAMSYRQRFEAMSEMQREQRQRADDLERRLKEANRSVTKISASLDAVVLRNQTLAAEHADAADEVARLRKMVGEAAEYQKDNVRLAAHLNAADLRDVANDAIIRSETNKRGGLLAALAAAADALASANIGPLFQHIKRGTIYKLIGSGELQASEPINEGTCLVAYRGEDGRVFFRPEQEFYDGRFFMISDGTK